jgi:hypothetical protein
MNAATDLISIGTDLDMALAPLDDICRDAPPLSDANRPAAYELALLSAELIGHASYGYLIAVLAERGIDPGTAKTIAPAFSSAITRVAGWVEAQQTGME